MEDKKTTINTDQTNSQDTSKNTPKQTEKQQARVNTSPSQATSESQDLVTQTNEPNIKTLQAELAELKAFKDQILAERKQQSENKQKLLRNQSLTNSQERVL